MKHSPLLLPSLAAVALALAPTTSPAAEAVAVSETFFTSSGDVDGDGDLDAIVVERATGLVLVGIRQPDGTLDFRQPVLSGIPEATGMAVGRFHGAGRDSIALTSPLSNRIQLLDPQGASLHPQTASFPVAGPRLVVPFDVADVGVAGVEDLALTAGFDGMLPTAVRVLPNAGDGTFGSMPEETIAHELLGWRPVDTARTGGAARVAFIENRAVDPVFRLVTPTATGLVSEASIPADPSYLEFIHGQFDANESDFIFYSPGSASVRIRRLQPGGASFGVEKSSLISGGVRQMIRLSRAGSDRILVINNSNQARIYSYDGTSGFTLEESLDPGRDPANPSLLLSARAAIALGDGSVAVLAGRGFSGQTEAFTVFAEDGAGYQTLQYGVPLPSLERGPARGGNVFFFAGQPLIDENPPLVGVMSVADWSSDLQLGGTDSVVGETFLSSSLGLGGPMAQSIAPAPQGTLGGLTNQHQPDVSFASLRRSAAVLGDASSGVDFEPEGGSYASAIQVGIRGGDSAASLFYRTDESSPFVAYSSPFWVFEDAIVQAYSELPGGARTPVASAAYTFTRQPGEQDRDGDGVPDFVELEKMLDPSAGADTDGDGSSDLDEILGGTDPADAGDFPDPATASGNGGQIFVQVTPHPWDGSSDGPVGAESGVTLEVHDVGGALLGAGATDQPLALPSARFACDPYEPDLRYLVVSTPAHYDIDSTGGDSRVGREMVGLIPAPDPARLSWSIETVDDLEDSGQYTSLAISPAGLPAISYLRATNPPYNGTLQYAERGQGGWTISQVDGDPTTSGNGYYCSLAFTPEGDPAISYLEGSPNSNLRYARRQLGAWSIETVDEQTSGTVGWWTSLAMLPDGSPAIAYQDRTVRDVKYAFHDGSIWQKWTAASAGDVGSHNSLAIDPATGEPVIASFELHFDDGLIVADGLEFLKFAGVGVLFDRQTVADSLADPSQSVGRGSSVAFDPVTGRPTISFGRSKLWFAAWDGAAWQIEVVADESASVTSLAYHPVTRRPVIAYYQSGDLKLATFDGVAWITEVLDTVGDVGNHVSLAFSSDGLAHIAYYDATNGAVKYATQSFVPGAAETDFTFDPLATPSDEADRWIAAAVAANQANIAQTIRYDLGVDQVVAFLLVEMRLGELMFQRGVGSTGSTPSFTPFRPSEITGGFLSPLVTPPQLLALETVPAFGSPEFTEAIRLREFLTTVDDMLADPVSVPALGHLKTLAREVYRISSLHHNASPSSYRPPFDVLREFVRMGTLDPAYAGVVTGLDAAAFSAMTGFLFDFRYSSDFARPKIDQTLVHLESDPPDGKTYAESPGGGMTWELRGADGAPFELPEAFALSAGSSFRLLAFDDLDPTADPRPVEVIAIHVTGVSLPGPSDLDGNLLPDDWEELFFGGTGSDAFASADGSGYSSLQQYFEGTDPTDPGDLPTVPSLTFEFTTTSAEMPDSDRFVLGFKWPEAHAEAFEFIVQGSVDLEDFDPIPATIQNLGGGHYQAEINLATNPIDRFFRVTVRLR